MQQHVPNGQIIVLNGTSSAGKSTLAKALQNLLPEPYLHIGIDTVIFALPKRYLNPPLWNEVFRYTQPPDGAAGLAIDAGPVGHRLVNGLHLSVAALARAQFWRVHTHVTYDLTVDTAQHTPEQCAGQIRCGLMPGRRSAALEQLRAQTWEEERDA